MSDLFHEAVPESYIRRIFAEMTAADWHTYQLLTKRSDRLRELAGRLPWPRSVWMGGSGMRCRWPGSRRHQRWVPCEVEVSHPVFGRGGRHSYNDGQEQAKPGE